MTSPDRSLLQDRDFRRWYVARLISIAGSVATTVALPVLVYQRTGSALLTSAVVGLEALPYLLFGLFAGAVADRRPRRRTMVSADLVSALVLATVPVADVLGILTVAQLLGCSFVIGTAFVWFDSASWGALVRLVSRERLPEANGLVWSTSIALGIVVPGLTGVVIAVTDPSVVLAVDTVSYLASAAVILSISTPLGPSRANPFEAPAPGMGADIAEGLRFIWEQGVLRTLTFAGFGLSLSGGAVTGLLVVHANDELGIGPGDGAIGVLFSASAAGALVASRMLPVLSLRVGAGRLSAWSLTVYVPLLIALGYAPSLALAVLAWAAWDAAYTLAITNGITIRQQVTPDDLQGRVNTTGRMIAWGGAPFGALLGGISAEVLGVQTTYVLLSVPVLVAAIALWLSPVRRFAGPEPLADSSDETAES